MMVLILLVVLVMAAFSLSLIAKALNRSADYLEGKVAQKRAAQAISEQPANGEPILLELKPAWVPPPKDPRDLRPVRIGMGWIGAGVYLAIVVAFVLISIYRR